MLNARVIDQNIHRAEAALRLLDQRGALFWIGQVGRMIENFRPVLLLQSINKRVRFSCAAMPLMAIRQPEHKCLRQPEADAGG